MSNDATERPVRLASLTRIGEGRAAEVFAWPGGGALKLFRSPGAKADVDREAAAMIAARAEGARAPGVVGKVTVEGRPGLVMDRVEGLDLLTELGSRPWKVFRTGRLMGDLHAQMHAMPVDAGLPLLKDALAAALQRSGLVPDRVREFALSTLEGLPDGSYLCHGDFHPGNIIEGPGGAFVIDWAGATRGAPAADVARSLLLLRAGEVPPGTPRLVRILQALGRRILEGRYLAAYRGKRPLPGSELQAWGVVAAAHRLAEGIEGEREYLLRTVERAMTDSHAR